MIVCKPATPAATLSICSVTPSGNRMRFCIISLDPVIRPAERWFVSHPREQSLAREQPCYQHSGEHSAGRRQPGLVQRAPQLHAVIVSAIVENAVCAMIAGEWLEQVRRTVRLHRLRRLPGIVTGVAEILVKPVRR